MNTPSALYCASCGAGLWRDPDKQLVHDPPADHVPIPTSNPRDITVAVQATVGSLEPVGEVVERLAGRFNPETQLPPLFNACGICGLVRIPRHRTACHGCSGRTIGPMTVEFLRAYGLAART